jgi:phenylacetate-coenzyme A ligase PaaK-like adenylate-forming protein
MISDLTEEVFNIEDDEAFFKASMKIFRFQADNNSVYKSFIMNLGIDPAEITNIRDIPFLPAEVFKTRKVIIDNLEEKIVFESSGTTGSVPGRHFVADPSVYEKSFLSTFRRFYGDPADYFIAALLPSYTERQNSSLVYMMNSLTGMSGDRNSGFYMNDMERLVENISNARASGFRTLLLGVSFALLDLAVDISPDLDGTIVMETGGMKGRRKEITREELHSILKKGLNVQSVHSEYGMTELLSQAYSRGDGLFFCPPWMRPLIRDPRDPLFVTDSKGITGGINIIDLANIFSCSFISTGDYGRIDSSGGFEVRGRFDNADIRGCNLMAD